MSMNNGDPYGDLLSIQPTELQFPLELGRPGGAYLHLTNITSENVAFKIKTTDWVKFFANPSRGIVSPGTTYRVLVVMDAWKKAPQDMLCVDKFLVQSFIAPKGAKEEDLTPEMFERSGSGKVVKEFMLGGVYVPVPEGSSHGASGVEKGIQGSCVLDAITSDAPLRPGLRRRCHGFNRVEYID